MGLKLNNLVTNNMCTRIENGSENLLMEHLGHLFSFYGSDKVVWQMLSVKVKTTKRWSTLSFLKFSLARSVKFNFRAIPSHKLSVHMDVSRAIKKISTTVFLQAT